MSEGYREFSAKIDEGYGWETTKETNSEKREIISLIIEAAKRPIKESNSRIIGYSYISLEALINSIGVEEIYFSDTPPKTIERSGPYEFDLFLTKAGRKTALNRDFTAGLFYNARQKAEAEAKIEAKRYFLVHKFLKYLPKESAEDYTESMLKKADFKEVVPQMLSKSGIGNPKQAQAFISEVSSWWEEADANCGGIIIGFNKELIEKAETFETNPGQNVVVKLRPEQKLDFETAEAFKFLGKRDISFLNSLTKRIT